MVVLAKGIAVVYIDLSFLAQRTSLDQGHDDEGDIVCPGFVSAPSYPWVVERVLPLVLPATMGAGQQRDLHSTSILANMAL